MRDHSLNHEPQSLVVQGIQTPGPLVESRGITLDGDSLARTIVGPIASSPTTAALRDHMTVMLRPAALCLDPKHIDAGGVLVTPHLVAPSADSTEPGDKPIFDAALVAKQPLVRSVTRGCLPKGRYAIARLPTGQAPTVPNEAGVCAEEGGIVLARERRLVRGEQRPVLLSQGSRAVVEIIDARDPKTCQENPVPEACRTP